MSSDLHPLALPERGELSKSAERPKGDAPWLTSYGGSIPGPASTSRAPMMLLPVDWLRGIPLIIVHLLCLGVFIVGWSWTAVGVAAAFYFVRMFAITGWYHRYFSHRTFKTSRACQFVFALLGSSCAQRGPLWWAGHHRHHHVTSDKPEDTAFASTRRVSLVPHRMDLVQEILSAAAEEHRRFCQVSGTAISRSIRHPHPDDLWVRHVRSGQAA